MQLQKVLLGLFAVIESPILVFSKDHKLIYELWPRQASFGRAGAATYDSKTDHATSAAPDSVAAALNNKNQEVLEQAQTILTSWPRNIGEPKYLHEPQDLGGILIFYHSYIIIGPIVPLRVKAGGHTLFIDNRTARIAANMWLNLMREQCRISVHASINTEPEINLVGLSANDTSHDYSAHEIRSDSLWDLNLDDLRPGGTESFTDDAEPIRNVEAASNSNTDTETVAATTSTNTISSNSGLTLEQLASPFVSTEELLAPNELAGLSTTEVTDNSQVPQENATQQHQQIPPTWNDDLSSIYAAQNTIFNPFDGSFHGELFDLDDSFLDKLELGKISTVHNHNQLRNEVLIQEAVREGNVEKLRWAYCLPPKGKAGILGFTPLRSWQNHAHLQNVLASRAAIDAGITPEESYTLSDKLFLAVESITDPLMAKHMRYVIARAFTELVHHHKEALHAAVSSSAKVEPVLVQKARFYIQKSLYEKLTLEFIAQFLGCSKEHLARAFKDYHSMTVMR